MAAIETVETLIVGTGFGGLCMAAKLKEAGRDDFIVLEKADQVGGTWRENSYPGAQCDIASAFYSYSFAPNPTWEFKWARQPQILQYLTEFSYNYGLCDHIRFGAKVISASYQQGERRWRVETAEGAVYSARFFIPAIGQLHHPAIPNYSGQESYQGVSFHSAEWDHSVDLSGKNVAVVGNAASAIQFIPEVAKEAGNLSVYMRSANWIVPKFDRQYTVLEKAAARVIPGLAKLYRFGIWSLGENLMWPAIQGKVVQSRIIRRMCIAAIKKHIKDPALQDVLVPDYQVGAKRILLSDDIYPALARDNVEVVTTGVEVFSTTGITDKTNITRDHDVIIYATGFHTNPFLKEIAVTGTHGRTIRDHWATGAHAYLGVMTAGFPNMLMLYGPNTNTGHTSVVFFLEQQVQYILHLMSKAGEGTIDVQSEAEAVFNQEIQERLQKLAWNQIDASWYMDGDRITNNWPGSSVEYKRRLKIPDWTHYTIG